jgi:hemerythrin
MLVWRDDLSVGHPDIDNDHKRLIAIINDFQNTISKWPPERVIHEALIGLHDYSLQHFQREEAIQAACAYPFAAEHAKEHAELLAAVTAEARSLFVQKTKPITAESLQFITDLLKHWLINHIIKSDLRMRDYVGKTGE